MTDKHTDEQLYDYMKQWIREEQFCELSVILDDGGDLDLAADYLVGTGAINSELCYPEYTSIEKSIERLAVEYRSSDSESHRKRVDDCFSDHVIVTCGKCNHVQFPSKENYEIYEDDLKDRCWECDHKGEITCVFWQDIK